MLNLKLLIKEFLCSLRIFREYTSKFEITKITDSSGHIFFGYYDKFPLNWNQNILLAHRYKGDVSLDNSLPVEIGFYDFANKKFIKKCSSLAWSWQLGSRLMWINDNEFIYNDFSSEKKRYVSRVFSLEEDTLVKEYDFPIFDISKNCKLIASTSFFEIRKYRPGYGYQHYEKDSVKSIEVREFDSEKIIKIITKSDLASFLPSKKLNLIKGSFFNHLRFSPNGKRLYFVYCHALDNKHKIEQPFVYDFNNDKLELVTKNSITHEEWISDDELLLYSSCEGEGFKYCIFDIPNLNQKIVKTLSSLPDGHPTYDKGNIICDSYPNRFGYQAIYFSEDFNKQRLVKIASFHSPIKYRGEIRCDLHPRLENNVCIVDLIDGDTKKRAMGLINLNHAKR